MYYDWPTEPMAYSSTPDGKHAQYLLGPALLAAPVVEAAASPSLLAKKAVWLPPGGWYDTESGAFYQSPAGGTNLSLQVDLRESPLFARAGSIVARSPPRVGALLGSAGKPYEELELTVYPGAASGHATVYEDDGHSRDYLGPAGYATTSVSYERSAAGASVLVSTSGGWGKMPEARAYTLRLPATLPATHVALDGAALHPCASADRRACAGGSFWFDGDGAALVVALGSVPTHKKHEVNISLCAAADDAPDGAAWEAAGPLVARGLVGLPGAIRSARWAKRNLDAVRVAPTEELTDADPLAALAAAGGELEALSLGVGTDAGAKAFAAAAAAARAALPAALAEMKEPVGDPWPFDVPTTGRPIRHEVDMPRLLYSKELLSRNCQAVGGCKA